MEKEEGEETEEEEKEKEEEEGEEGEQQQRPPPSLPEYIHTCTMTSVGHVYYKKPL